MCLVHLRGIGSRINGQREANPHLKSARPPATERGHPSPLYAGWSRFCCRRTLDSAHLADHVLAAVRIGDAQSALRIIPPITVHDEAVSMFAGRQRDRCRPDPNLAFLHWDAALLPVTEITDQQNAHGSWCGETKRLLCGSFHLPCHTSLSFPELGLFAEQQRPCLGTPADSWLRAESSINAQPTTRAFQSFQYLTWDGSVSRKEVVEILR